MAEKTINFAILDRILPEYQKISKAPNRSEVFDVASERKKKYKSIDTRTGDVFLIQNPSVWAMNAAGEFVRPKPKFIMSYKDALKAASENSSDIGGDWGI